MGNGSSGGGAKVRRRDFLRHVTGGGAAAALLGIGCGAVGFGGGTLLAGCGSGGTYPFDPDVDTGGPSPSPTPTPSPTATPPASQARVLVPPEPLVAGVDNGETVVQIATVENVLDGRNFHVYATTNEVAQPTRIVQTIAWTGSPNQYARTIFDAQSRPAQIVDTTTGYVTTLDWNADNTSVTLRVHNESLAVVGAVTVRREGDNYVLIGPGSSAPVATIPAAQVEQASAASRSAGASRFVAAEYGRSVLGSLLGLAGPYVLLLTAVVLLLGTAAAATTFAQGVPTQAGILIAILILALSFALGLGSARSQLAGGHGAALALTVLANLFIPHTYNPASGFYEN